MNKLIDLSSYPITPVLKLLLEDKTTGKNIIWATDTYAENGEGFQDTDELNFQYLKLHTDIIVPRIQKTLEEQQSRTRKKAEVFTPVWLCCQMNNYCDDEWFGRKNVFNILNDDNTWREIDGKIEFTEEHTWQSYVDSRRLEITCGEAPYLVSRYDVVTGEMIVPPKHRIGILDRKMRIVNENTDSYDKWMKWTIRAYESCYGYEYQGDNLLIARCNLLLTFVDYYEERWQKQPSVKELTIIARRIVWNIWQMDGFKDTVPLGKPHEDNHQINIFEILNPKLQDDIIGNQRVAEYCKIQNWRGNYPVIFHELKGEM